MVVSVQGHFFFNLKNSKPSGGCYSSILCTPLYSRKSVSIVVSMVVSMVVNLVLNLVVSGSEW